MNTVQHTHTTWRLPRRPLSDCRIPRRIERSAGSQQAAYRYLAAVILRLDVTSLVSELRAARRKFSLPQAA